MAYFTKEQVKQAILKGETQGFSGDDIVNEMVNQNHQLEGLNGEERRTPGAFPYEQAKDQNFKQLGKQLYNVGNEAFQFGKQVVTQPHKIVAGVGNLAVGLGKQAIEASSESISQLGGAVGLDIPQIKIPTFHPDGTVSYDDEDAFEGMSKFIGQSTGITSLAKGQPRQALEDVNKTLFEAPLSTALDVMGAGVAKAGKLPKITRAPKAATPVRPGLIKTAAKGIGDELMQKTTGLGKENMQTIVNNPDLYRSAEAQQITRGSIAHKAQTGIESRLKQIGEAGSEYDAIRQSKGTVTVPKKGVVQVLSKYGLDFDDGKLVVTSESRPLKAGDIAEIEDFMATYGSETLTRNGFLNAREKLSKMSEFDVSKSDVGNAIARDLREYYNSTARPQIKGLAELDKKFSSEVGFIKQMKREYLTTAVDETGRRVTTLKDTALSRIMNSTNKNRDAVLKRLEKIAPGIGDEIRVLKALEDVQDATGNKIGTYFRSGMMLAGGASLLTGGAAAIPAFAAAILTSPQVIARVLEWYGRKAGKGIDADVMLKMQRGAKLDVDEKAFLQEAVTEYEKAASPSENRLINLKGMNEGRPGIDYPSQPKKSEFQKGVDKLEKFNKRMSDKPSELSLEERLAQAKKKLAETTNPDHKDQYEWLINKLENKISPKGLPREGATTGLEALAAEAKKYRSPEEFAETVQEVLSRSNMQVIQDMGREYLPLRNVLTDSKDVMKQTIRTPDDLKNFYRQSTSPKGKPAADFSQPQQEVMADSKITNGVNPKGLQNMIDAKYKGEAEVHVHDFGDDIELSKIEIPEELRSQGIGTNVMKDIIKFADKNRRTIRLSVSDDLGGDVSRLKAFYKRFGFTEYEPDQMVRQPKK